MFRSKVLIASACFSLFIVWGCSPKGEPIPGPDKQGAGTIAGAAMGAGAGAVTGAQLSSGTGPGIAVGAGLGAAWGMIKGLGFDLLEEDELQRQAELDRARELAWVNSVLAEHYERRLELHPSRDIFPADVFFASDSSELRPEAVLLSEELARLTKRRVPWSRIVIAVYVTAADPDSVYAERTTRKRAEAIALEFVRSGIDARRVLTQAVTLPEPLVIDPDDSPDRYRQAVEVIPLDN